MTQHAIRIFGVKQNNLKDISTWDAPVFETPTWEKTTWTSPLKEEVKEEESVKEEETIEEEKETIAEEEVVEEGPSGSDDGESWNKRIDVI